MINKVVGQNADQVFAHTRKMPAPTLPRTYGSEASAWTARRKICGFTLEQVARASEYGLPFMSRLRDIEDGRALVRSDERQFLDRLYGD